ncbi:MAG: aspartate kinase [bacterium]
MRIRVIKFGGTSVSTPENRRLAASKVIQAKQAGYDPVVVVSAIGRAGAPYATDTLIKHLVEVDPAIAPEPREMDLMMACGEIISTVIFTHTLKTMGHSAVALTGGQAGIITDQVFGNARIIEINPVNIINALEQGQIPVVCGFQGVATSSWGITTLGRGGSDTTASALGAALNAEAVDIFTDVDGVKSADPDMVECASILRQVSYAEVAEIAHQGAKVLHPRAAEIAMRFNIPLWVKSTFTDDPGTEVVSDDRAPDRRITGITHTGKLNYLSFDLPQGSDKARIELEVYRLVSMAKANMQLISVDPTHLGFATPSSKFGAVCEYLDGLVLPIEDETGKRCYVVQVGDKARGVKESQLKLLRESDWIGEIIPLVVKVTENCSMVSVIGKVFGKQPGLFFTILEVLSEAGIPVLQTADSDHSVSCLVPDNHTHRAVKLLHERFELEKIG